MTVLISDPKTYAPYDMTGIWRSVRSDDPVHWHPESTYGPGFRMLTRYADIAAVLRAPAGPAAYSEAHQKRLGVISLAEMTGTGCGAVP